MPDNKRSTDVAGWIQAVIAAVALSAAFFAWYISANSSAHAVEAIVVYDKRVQLDRAHHNDRGDSHYEYRTAHMKDQAEYRKEIREEKAQIRESVIRIEGSVRALQTGVEQVGNTAKENRRDIKEILDIIRNQNGEND